MKLKKERKFDVFRVVYQIIIVIIKHGWLLPVLLQIYSFFWNPLLRSSTFTQLSMGFIILFQSDYLRFTPENKTDSVIACFITLLLEVGIFIVLTCYERKQAEGNISQPEYIKFDQNQSRPRESSIRGIPLVDLSVLREREMEE